MKNLVFLVIALVLAVVATVLAFILLVPEKRREKLNAFGKFLHDALNFKYLIVEKVLQALYIFATAFVILYGVLQLFNVQQSYWGGGATWMGGRGLLLNIMGPIAVRLSYELIMLAVLVVKNVIAINNKLRNQNEGTNNADIFSTPDMSGLKDAIQQKKEQVEQAVQARREESAEQPAAPENTENK